MYSSIAEEGGRGPVRVRVRVRVGTHMGTCVYPMVHEAIGLGHPHTHGYVCTPYGTRGFGTRASAHTWVRVYTLWYMRLRD